MSAPAGWQFWPSFLLTAPITLPQAMWLRRTAPRMPAVLSNADGGTISVDERDPVSRHVLVVGESTAVGVGCERPEQAIAPQLARALSERARQPQAWKVIGGNGLTAEQLTRLLGSQSSAAVDATRIAVVLLGANDTVMLTRRATWQRQLVRLRNLLRARGVGRIYLAPVPPMWQFTLLPQPLRWVLGMRARMLDAARVAVAASLQDVVALTAEFPDDAELLAPDGYHPGPAACALWAKQMADIIERGS